ncbi:MAG: acyltransferase [Acidobacteriaceae bacterium]|nr:acyltransferase [Acidobacteriaceae bacterium]MBV9781735.1 acyltransferase [Acidobacteriaceae bacterium]
MKETIGPTPGRIPQLDGLRAMAMLLVFVHQALDVPLLWMGVDVFFVLSGFLITGILMQRKESGGSYFGHFYSRRAKRILPPYYLLMIVASLLFGTAWMKEWYWYVFFSTNIPEAFNHVSHESLSVLWSLAVEEQFYLVWPIIVLLVPEAFLPWTAGGLFLLAPMLRIIATPIVGNFAPIYHLTPFRMDLLSAGALIAIAWRKNPDIIRKYSGAGKITLLVSLGLLLVLSQFVWFRTNQNTTFTNVFIYLLTLLFAAGSLTWALNGRTVFASILSLPVLRYLGRISYSMYLIHFSAILFVKKWFHNPVAVVLLSFAAAFLYSAASWHFLEKPILGSSNNKVGAEKLVPAGARPAN